MLNEQQEFAEYTQPRTYGAARKSDDSYLGRFTFDMLLKFEGLARVLTIIARGYLFSGQGPDPEYARRALCAWCSIPEKEKASPKGDWQFKTDFRELNGEFPELVDEDGRGWFFRHTHNVMDFVDANPEVVSKPAVKKAAALRESFDESWRGMVIRLQIPIFHEKTSRGWLLRFDDVIADALELGPLRDPVISLSPESSERLASEAPGVPREIMETLAQYYLANKPEDSGWAVLPVTNFDAWLGSAFSRKILPQIPETILVRQQSGGVCRFRMKL